MVGGGVFGAAGALSLRLRGWDVTLLDPHPLPYRDASSTDVSKLVRMDYGSDAFYHELAERALEGWDRWNAEWPRPLYHEEGLLVLSRGPMVPGGFEHDSARVLLERGHRVERLAGPSLTERFPAWSAGAYAEGYYNPRAGWVESAAVVEHLIALGESAGVVRRGDAWPVAGETGDALLAVGSRVSGLRTASGAHLPADRVVVCAGAWTGTLLPWLSDRLYASAQPVLCFGVDDPELYSGPRFPPWAADIANSGWYGFPALHDGRLKIGHHGPGRPVRPDERGEVPESHVAAARTFLGEAIPALAEAPVVARRMCLYCDTPDGDFLIAEDPDRDGLVVASGGAGHAFKFAPILGSLVADATERRPSPWGGRFAWRSGARRGKEEARYAGD